MIEPETQIRAVGFHSREGQGYISGASAFSFYCSLLLKDSEGAKVHLLILLPAKCRHCHILGSVQFISVAQSVWLFAIPWTTACQVSLSIMNSWSLLKLMSIELVMPSNHLILCRLLLLLPSVFPSIRVLSNESVLRIRWPNLSISPSIEYSGKIFFRIDWLDLLAVQGTLKSPPTPQFKSINSSALSFLYSPNLTSIHDYWKSHSFD